MLSRVLKPSASAVRALQVISVARAAARFSSTASNGSPDIVEAVTDVVDDPAGGPVYRAQSFAPTGAPTRPAQEIIEEIKAQREAETAAMGGNTQIGRSPMRLADDILDESDPLTADMFVRDPQDHEATLVWFGGLGDTAESASNPFEFIQIPSTRLAIPSPPKIPVSALDDAMERAWFDVMAPKYEEHLTEDRKGMDRTMVRVHELLDAECDRAGLSHPPNPLSFLPRRLTPRDVRAAGARRVIVGGFGQGAALALEAALTYPHRVGGVIVFSGFPANVRRAVKRAERAVAEAEETAAALTAAGEAAPESPVPGAASPILVVHGGSDEAVPWADFAEPRWDTLKESVLGKELGLRTTLRLSPPMGHWVGSNELMDVQHWVAERVKEMKKKTLAK